MFGWTLDGAWRESSLPRKSSRLFGKGRIHAFQHEATNGSILSSVWEIQRFKVDFACVTEQIHGVLYALRLHHLLRFRVHFPELAVQDFSSFLIRIPTMLNVFP